MALQELCTGPRCWLLTFEVERCGDYCGVGCDAVFVEGVEGEGVDLGCDRSIDHTLGR
jgi:hypothetical protein